MTIKRVMVDMSATLIHHGHIRLLNRAADIGEVVVGLTSDTEIEAKKGYQPELCFAERREILLAISSVTEVVETPWSITDGVLDKYKIDLLVHGDDNRNDIKPERLLIFPRTTGVSSNELRHRAMSAVYSRLRIEGYSAAEAKQLMTRNLR
jgi:cytidyltransferase-like protein